MRTTHSRSRDIVIVGGGLAGLSAAIELADSGAQVTLLEARSHLGGRTSSWNEAGMDVESGLHRVLGFYRHFPALIKKAGLDIDGIVAWEDEIEIRTLEGERAVYGASLVHKPLKTLSAPLLNRKFVSMSELASLIPFFAKGLWDWRFHPEELDSTSVLSYAKRHGVKNRSIERILIPLTEGIFFLPPDKYSAYDLFGLVGPYLPHMPFTARIGAFRGGMTRVLCDPLAESFESKGGAVRRDAPVTKLVIEGGAVTGVLINGKEEVRADTVILASSLGPAKGLIKEAFGGSAWCAGMLALPTMPAITFQAELKSPSVPVDRTTFGPGTRMGSFAEQSRTTFKGKQGRISGCFSEPETLLGSSPKSLENLAKGELAKLDIDLGATGIKDYRIISEPDDFYSLSVGSEKLRPRQATPVPGLILAGDYTKQPYLATMEGAVYSGKVAAALARNANNRSGH